MAAPGAASATVIDDNVLSRGYWSDCNQNSCSTSPRTSGSYDHFVDVIGNVNYWDTSRIEVTRNGDNFDFRIYTNKDSNSEGGVGYADFFIDLQPDNSITGPFDGWDYALDLYGSNKGLYRLDSTSDWKTSQDIFGDNESVTYGGLFRAADCGTSNAGDGSPLECNSVPVGPGGAISGPDVRGFAAPVKVTTGAEYLNSIDLDIEQQPSNLGYGSTVLSFSIAASILNQGGFDVFWGTAECANDAIWGHVPSTQTPEPFALSLFGLGLAGAYLGARRRHRA
jgi:hypothetical protein